MRQVRDKDLIDLSSARLADDAPVRAHLEACQECRRRYGEIRAVYDALGSWEVGAASADLWPAIEQRFGRPQSSLRRPIYTWAIPLTRAAAAVLIGLGLGHGVARRWGPASPAVTPETKEVDAVLALHILEGPSATGLSLILDDLRETGTEEGTP